MKPLQLLLASVTRNWPVLFRGSLYFTLGFLAVMIEKIGPTLEKGEWPTGPRLVLGILCGTFSGGVAVRAFYDGSAERHKDEQAPIAEAEKKKAIAEIETDTALLKKTAVDPKLTGP